MRRLSCKREATIFIAFAKIFLRPLDACLDARVRVLDEFFLALTWTAPQAAGGSAVALLRTLSFEGSSDFEQPVRPPLLHVFKTPVPSFAECQIPDLARALCQADEATEVSPEISLKGRQTQPTRQLPGK